MLRWLSFENYPADPHALTLLLPPMSPKVTPEGLPLADPQTLELGAAKLLTLAAAPSRAPAQWHHVYDPMQVTVPNSPIPNFPS